MGGVFFVRSFGKIDTMLYLSVPPAAGGGGCGVDCELRIWIFSI